LRQLFRDFFVSTSLKFRGGAIRKDKPSEKNSAEQIERFQNLLERAARVQSRRALKPQSPQRDFIVETEHYLDHKGQSD
jgi:hypothetical protein